MGDVLLNGRRPLDWQLPAVWRGHVRLLAEYPREPSPVPRPVTDVLGPLP